MSTIEKHRSIRKYSDKEISNEILNEILNAGIRASNTGNMQLYSIIITRDIKIKQQLSPAHFNQPMITNAPVVITFCADINRFVKWCKSRNANVGFNNLETFISATIDTCLVAQNVCIAAEEKGLGICYLGTTTYNPEQIIEVLKLPTGVIPITTVTIGYPNENPPLTARLSLESITHNELYKDYTNEDINNIYYDIENDPNNKKFIEENNKDNLAQVFAEVRYPKDSNEFFSKKLFDILKKQKFI